MATERVSNPERVLELSSRTGIPNLINISKQVQKDKEREDRGLNWTFTMRLDVDNQINKHTTQLVISIHTIKRDDLYH